MGNIISLAPDPWDSMPGMQPLLWRGWLPRPWGQQLRHWLWKGMWLPDHPLFRSKIILRSSIGSEQSARYSELGGCPLLGGSWCTKSMAHSTCSIAVVRYNSGWPLLGGSAMRSSTVINVLPFLNQHLAMSEHCIYMYLSHSWPPPCSPSCKPYSTIF